MLSMLHMISFALDNLYFLTSKHYFAYFSNPQYQTDESYETPKIVVKKIVNKKTLMKKIQIQSPTITRTLTTKYSSNEQAPTIAWLHLTHSIVHAKMTQHVSSFNIHYDEAMIMSNVSEKEYLKRFYWAAEYPGKRTALVQYYKFHRNYPVHLRAEVEMMMLRYQDSRNKMQRKFIKMLMNQPVSSSNSECTIGSTTRRQNQDQSNNTVFSMNLQQLNFEDSSLALREICDQIQDRLKNVKPLYLYRGIAEDESKKFKKFILASQTYNKEAFTQSKPFPKKKIMEKSSHAHEGTFHPRLLSETGKQSENMDNISGAYRSKFDSNKQFRKTFNVLPPENFRKLHKKQNLTRTIRNKTANIKPQSFSKTTANDTVSREEEAKPIRSRSGNSVRIRNCRSTNRRFAIPDNKENKNNNGNSKVVKLPEINKKFKENRKEKSVAHLRKGCLLIRPNTSGKIRSKKMLENVQHKKSEERTLQRQESMNCLTRKQVTAHEQRREAKKYEPHGLEILIRSKLKLRS